MWAMATARRLAFKLLRCLALPPFTVLKSAIRSLCKTL
jgi:hypothetical protein